MNWRRLKCILTGGCVYRADELQFTYEPSEGFSKAKYKIYAVLVDKLILWAALHERKKENEDGK